MWMRGLRLSKNSVVVIARMAGAVINNQVNAMSPAIGMKKTLNGWMKMFSIILYPNTPP